MPLRPRTIALSFLALVALGAISVPHAADQTPTVMFMLDGSGSMWGPFGNDRRPKFEISRETLTQTLARVRPDARLGLSSFGHRRRGYCGDVEVIVPPDANNLEKITAPLSKLNATGITIIMIEHIMQAVMRFSQRVVCLDAGRIICEGSPQDIVRNPDVQKAYLGA
jgi:hypothetical protein